MKNLKVELSTKGINEIIDFLENYRNELDHKCEVFCQKLCELGIEVIDARIVGKGDSDTSHETEITIGKDGTYTNARLRLSGEDILFIEFGAGVHYNGAAGTSPNPKGSELGYTIGSYGKGHGTQEFWYYKDDSGNYVRSYGTQATMPMYSASIEMIKQMKSVAKEVFNG